MVPWEDYSETKDIWQLILAVQYLQRLLNNFDKDYLKKLIATSPSINIKLPIIKLFIRLSKPITIKKKQGRIPKNRVNRQAKTNGIFCLYACSSSYLRRETIVIL